MGPQPRGRVLRRRCARSGHLPFLLLSQPVIGGPSPGGGCLGGSARAAVARVPARLRPGPPLAPPTPRPARPRVTAMAALLLRQGRPGSLKVKRGRAGSSESAEGPDDGRGPDGHLRPSWWEATDPAPGPRRGRRAGAGGRCGGGGGRRRSGDERTPDPGRTPLDPNPLGSLRCGVQGPRTGVGLSGGVGRRALSEPFSAASYGTRRGDEGPSGYLVDPVAYLAATKKPVYMTSSMKRENQGLSFSVCKS